MVAIFFDEMQRIGVYNQHAADQLELSESPVEYLMVILFVEKCKRGILYNLFAAQVQLRVSVD